jgi:hypothetical protein
MTNPILDSIDSFFCLDCLKAKTNVSTLGSAIATAATKSRKPQSFSTSRLNDVISEYTSP